MHYTKCLCYKIIYLFIIIVLWLDAFLNFFFLNCCECIHSLLLKKKSLIFEINLFNKLYMHTLQLSKRIYKKKKTLAVCCENSARLVNIISSRCGLTAPSIEMETYRRNLATSLLQIINKDHEYCTTQLVIAPGQQIFSFSLYSFVFFFLCFTT